MLIINGSLRINGTLRSPSKKWKRFFEAQGIETETVQVGNKDVGAASPADGAASLGMRL